MPKGVSVIAMDGEGRSRATVVLAGGKVTQSGSSRESPDIRDCSNAASVRKSSEYSNVGRGRGGIPRSSGCELMPAGLSCKVSFIAPGDSLSVVSTARILVLEEYLEDSALLLLLLMSFRCRMDHLASSILCDPPKP